GPGWSHSLGWRLEEQGETLVVQCGDGSRVELPRVKASGDEVRNGAWGVLRHGDRYAIRPANEFVHYFSPSSPGAATFKLDFIEYRGRGRIALHYDRERLVMAVDTVGRQIHFQSTP